MNFRYYNPDPTNFWIIRRFQKNWDNTACALLKTRPELAKGDSIGILKRKWEYMYVYAEAGFARAYTTMHIFTFVRPVRSMAQLFLTDNNVSQTRKMSSPSVIRIKLCSVRFFDDKMFYTS